MDCHLQPELSLDEWGQILMAPLKGQRYPIGGMIDLNERCNLACVHCYINQSVSDLAAQKEELTTEQIKHIFDQIADAGCLYLTITGGEPLVRKDFPELYLYARQKGFLVTLFTNATMITPHIVDVLSSAQPQMVEISLYGATQATYEAVTQVPGSFQRCMRGIQLLHNRGIKIGLKGILLTLNKHELPAMRALADQMGVNFRYDGTIWPRIDGDERTYQNRLSIDQMLELDREDTQRFEEWQKKYIEFQDVFIRDKNVLSCGAGLNTFHITSSGHLCACIMLRNVEQDLVKMDFNQAWEKIGELRTMERQQHTACETCTVGALCSQCPGWSQIVHGDFETPDNYLCQLGKARAGQIELNLL